MAHAASQLKKNRGEVDVNAIEDEKEKRRKSRRTASREQKRKVKETRAGSAGWWLHLLCSTSVVGPSLSVYEQVDVDVYLSLTA